MERAWLERELAKGRSIESLARELGRHASTVAYWMRRYGLSSAHAARHSARGGIDEAVLARLVADGLTVREIAASLGLAPTTVRHWLRRYGLRTHAATYRAMVKESSEDQVPSRDGAVRRCHRHGQTRFVRTRTGALRCVRCRSDAVSKRRRRVKATLVREAGGRCALCGYDRCIAALHFHHLDPDTKRFSLAGGGLARSMESARREAVKCILLCANCHAEVEAGLATIPPDAALEEPRAG